MHFRKFLFELRAINFQFCRKNTDPLNNKTISLKFMLASFLKKNQTEILINKGPSSPFEKFNRKLRINFLKMATKNICEFSKLAN